MKRLYDCKGEYCQFSPVDQILALTPGVGFPFQGKFTSPCTVDRQLSELNYLIVTPKQRKFSQCCHVNLLKPYYSCIAPDTLDSNTQNSTVCPTLTMNSLSSGLMAPALGLDGEVDVIPPNERAC